MLSPFGVNTFGTCTGFRIFTVRKSVAVQPKSPVAVSMYGSSFSASKDGFRIAGSLRPNAGVHAKVRSAELAVAPNCNGVPSGTVNEGPASITGCKCTVIGSWNGSEVQPTALVTVSVTSRTP